MKKAQRPIDVKDTLRSELGKDALDAALIGTNGTKLCPVCAERDLQERYEDGER